MKHNLKKQHRLMAMANNRSQPKVEQFLRQAQHAIDHQMTHTVDSFDYEAAVWQLSRTRDAAQQHRQQRHSRKQAAHLPAETNAAAPRLPLRLAVGLRRPQLATAMMTAAIIAVAAVLLFVIPINNGSPLVATNRSLFAPVDTVLRFSSSALTTDANYEFELALAQLY